MIGETKKANGEADVVYATDYYPFGGEITYAENGYRYGYQGQYAEKDKESAWLNFALRMYDPAIGRWMTTDPYGQYASPYVGMGNDPVNSVDPDGGYSKWGATWRRALSFLTFQNPSDVYYNGKEYGFNTMKGETITGHFKGGPSFVMNINANVDLGLRVRMKEDLWIFGVDADVNILSGNLFSFSGNVFDRNSWKYDFVGKDGTAMNSNVKIEASIPVLVNMGVKAKFGGYAEMHGRFHRFTDDDGDAEGSAGISFGGISKNYHTNDKGGVNRSKVKAALGYNKGVWGISGGGAAGVILTGEFNVNMGVKY